MTVSPNDLKAVREAVMSLTGVTDPADIGIVGDAAHDDGYHLGRDRLKQLGILDSDFSVRLARDRQGLTNSASALDITLSWKIGGRAPDGSQQTGRQAATRFSNLIVAELRREAPGSEVLRAINWSVDGSKKISDDPKIGKKRVDRQVGLSKTKTSTDSVDTHTHFEFFRDTEGTRAGAFLTLLRRCILQAQGMDDDMPLTAGDANVVWYTKNLPNETPTMTPATALLSAQQNVANLVTALKDVAVDVAELKARPPVRSEDLKAALLDPQVLTAIANAVLDAQAAMAEK